MATDPAYALHEVGRDAPNPDGSVDVHYTWSVPASITQADQVFFDVSPDAGFTSYIPGGQQQLFPVTTTHLGVSIPPIGAVWVRVNAHYPGHIIGGIDMGWEPSNVIVTTVPGGLPLPSGIPAMNIMLATNGKTLSWVPGVGFGTAVVALQAVDISLLSDFGDILQAGFVPPVGGQVSITAMPFSVNMPVGSNSVVLNNLPNNVYIRVNSLFARGVGQPGVLWLSSQIIHVVGTTVVPVHGINPLILGAAALGAIVLASRISDEPEYEYQN